jgi:microcystin-dependent protein
VSQSLRLCNGDELPKQQYAALAGKIRDRFGGDAQHFRLPDLRSAAPAKFNYYIRLQGVFLPNS